MVLRGLFFAYQLPFTRFTEGGYGGCLGWATRYIEELQRGTTVQFRPRGDSMAGKIDSGQLVTVQPAGELELKVGTIVLCKVGRAQCLHLIKAIRGQQYQTGNNRGGINGWIKRTAIYGVVTEIA